MVSSVVEKTSVAHKETALILWFDRRTVEL